MVAVEYDLVVHDRQFKRWSPDSVSVPSTGTEQRSLPCCLDGSLGIDVQPRFPGFIRSRGNTAAGLV